MAERVSEQSDGESGGLALASVDVDQAAGEPVGAFADLPDTAASHFRLFFYAAVYHLVHYLHSLGSGGGDGLRETLAKYAFLGRYLDEMLARMPDGLSWAEGLAWWERTLDSWETAATCHLPLRALVEHCGLPFSSRIALLLAGLVEEDSRFGTVFARLQEPLGERRPCLELVGQIALSGTIGDRDGWGVCRPMLSAGLVEPANREAPRSEWALRVPSALWNAIRGEVEAGPVPGCQVHPQESFPEMGELVVAEEFRERLAQVPTLLRIGKASAVVLRGMQGSERLEIAGAIARALGRGLIAVEPPLGQARGEAEAADRRWELVGPLCAMTGCLPAITWDLGPGETAQVPALHGYQGPVVVMLGLEGGLSDRGAEQVVTLMVPSLGAEQRQRVWQQALGTHPVDGLAEIAERHQLPSGHIRHAGKLAIAQAALEGHEAVTPGDAREACRALNRQLLDTLAARLEVEGSWDRLVVGDGVALKLRELTERCRHRERLLAHLSPAFGTPGNRGVRALFTGASGTGKTLAARILAAELGMDLYRVDLGAVVNKYIGETEKNLHRVLSRAEELDVILLLDEGDALLSSRTEVRSANDRYANLETNYLLQRLETYQGIVLVTTNLGQNVDSAFQRRMDVVVSFVPPQARERRQIWWLHLPARHALDGDYLDAVAESCAMTGGQIRNAALHATLLAVSDGTGVVTQWHLDEAIQSEYRKAGGLCPLWGDGQARQAPAGMAALLDALA